MPRRWFYCLIFICAAMNMDKMGLLFDLIGRIRWPLTTVCRLGCVFRLKIMSF